MSAVRRAVRRDIRELRQRAPDLARSGLAAMALALAERIDDPGVSATAAANCAGQALALLDRLRELAPPLEEADALDDLTTRRAARTAGRAAASGRVDTAR